MRDVSRAVIVTGGGRGIGRAISRRLARDFAVIGVGRTESDLVSLQAEIEQTGGRCGYCAGDVTHAETARQAVRIADDRGWPIGCLVCNAGIGKSGPTAELSYERWREVLDVNLDGALHFVQACLPRMVERGGGTICLMSSILGVRGAPYDAAYAASKHALVGLARSLALEYGKHNITAVPICPGYVESDMTRRVILGVMERRGIGEAEAEERVARFNPQRRIIPAEEVAEMVAFVCEGKVPSLSGHPLMLTGGA